MALTGYLKDLRDIVGHRAVLLPAVAALIFNEHNEVLLHRSSDDGMWRLIGGAMEPGEEPAESAVRESWEETGLSIQAESLVGVYRWPRVTYPNGDVCDYVGIVFRCSITGGELRMSDESLELRFFATNDLPPLEDIEQRVIDGALRGSVGYFSR